MDLIESIYKRVLGIPGWVWFLLLFFSGIVLKIIIWNLAPFVSRDSVYYIEQIQTWHDCGGQSFFENAEGSYLPPLLFFLAQGPMLFGVSAIHAGQIINVVFGSLIPILVYLIAFEFTNDKKIAAVATLIALFHPFLNTLSLEVQRDVGYLFSSSFMIWMLILGFHCNAVGYWLLSGIALACSVLFRVEALEFIPLSALVCVCYAYSKHVSLCLFCRPFIAFLLGALLCIFILVLEMGMPCKSFIGMLLYYSDKVDVPMTEFTGI